MLETLPPKALRICSWCIAVCGGLVFTIGVVRVIQKGETGFALVGSLLEPAMWLTWGIASLVFVVWGWPALVRQQRLRNAAKGYWQRGEAVVVPLIEPQPIPDAGALSLPTIIRMRPHWRLHIPVYIGLFVIFIALLVVAWNSGSPAAPGLTIAEGGFGLVVYAGLILLLATSASSSLVVSEEGISLRQSGFTQRVHWDESRLFALVVGARHSPATLGYELGGTRSAVRWMQRLRPTWYAFSRPELPFEVYDRKMRALLSLIAARTKLPLYDVR